MVPFFATRRVSAVSVERRDMKSRGDSWYLATHGTFYIF